MLTSDALQVVRRLKSGKWTSFYVEQYVSFFSARYILFVFLVLLFSLRTTVERFRVDPAKLSASVAFTYSLLLIDNE